MPPAEVPDDDASGRGAVVIAVAATACVCVGVVLVSMIGPLVIVLAGTLAVIGGVGALHYWLWGRAMLDEADDQGER